MNWFNALAISLPVGSFIFLAIAEWRGRKRWWRESQHSSFFRN